MPRAPARSRRGAGWKQLLALGDSYTVGEGVSPARSWPAWLVQRLRVEGIAIADPLVVARTGFSCAELLAELRAALRDGRVAPPFELVTLQAGVNDQYRGRGVSDWERTYAVLLEEALRLAGDDASRVVSISVPDWGVTPFAASHDAPAIAAAIDELNRVQQRLALATGAHWVEVTDLSRAAASDRSMLADDCLHPSAQMYALWVERLLPVAREVLTDRNGA